MSTKRGAETLTDYEYKDITIMNFNTNPDAKRLLSLRSRRKNEYKDMFDE